VAAGLVRTIRDRIGSYVDMQDAAADPADFWRFWSDEAATDEVPRDWTRAALAYTQITMKIVPGNARDEQHSTHLVDGLCRQRRRLADRPRAPLAACYEFVESPWPRQPIQVVASHTHHRHVHVFGAILVSRWCPVRDRLPGSAVCWRADTSHDPAL
jgi:hypothetical protein